jgi:tRNA(Ile2)-agmatinylcytidine synthase
MIIGIDDTDSRKGMCTTYLCAVLVNELKRYGAVSTPFLVRLNPCIPFKTRGNGAVAFKIELTTERGKKELKNEVKEAVIARVRELSEIEEEGTNPGVVFIDCNASHGMSVKSKLKHFFEHAVRDVLKIDDAYALISEFGFDYFGLNNKRGIIGALAAASFCVLHHNESYDFTYELMAYRQKERWGTPRFVEEASVWRSDEATYPLTWDTVDVANNKLVFVPHSPCPVLFGIRGDSIDAIYKAYELIEAEPVNLNMLFITNQGTDYHLITSAKKKPQDYHSYIINGVVHSNPRTIKGGHVLFTLTLTTERGEEGVECVAYEPTKGFRNVIRKLRVGDEITVFGSLKKNTINLEKIEIRKLNCVMEQNPRCERCGRSMKSVGRSQGYRCKHCGTVRADRDKVIIERAIGLGLYEVPPVARRHISKPLIRLRRLDKKIHPSR